jgi:hypothetical protein
LKALVKSNKRAALALVRDPLAAPGLRQDAVTSAWRHHRRSEAPEQAAEIEKAERFVDWSSKAERSTIFPAPASISSAAPAV